MKLINATPSPYGRKVAIALKEKKIAYDVQYDVPWAETTIVADYSPLQQLPILITDAGENIYDSSYILDWLELTYPAPSLLPQETAPRLKALLIRMLAERLAEFAQMIVFEEQKADPSTPWLERQRRKIATGTAECERLIGDRRLAVDEPINLGDIALGCTLGMFDFIIEQGFADAVPEYSWRERHSNLAAYAEALGRRRSFSETVPVMFKLDLKEVVQ